MAPSKSCGPFRIYSRMYDILPIAVEGFPTVIREIFDWVFSAMILIPLFIILCLIIYYKGQMSMSYKEMIKKLKEQLSMEGRDKQFLLQQLHAASGDSPKKNKTPEKKPEKKSEAEKNRNEAETPHL